MGKDTSSALAARAWRLLRLALRRWLVVDIQHAVNHLKSLCTDLHSHHRHLKPLCSDRHSHHRHAYMLHYGEYELSFDETPNLRFKKCHRRPLFPCIDPPLVSFDDDDKEDDEEDDGDSNFIPSKEECEMDEESCNNDEVEREKGIDLKAEEFISRFYQEMKLQRQVSCLRYNEMIHRGIS